MDPANENRKQRPSEMDRDQFVESIGRVYEHSPWIADALFRLGLTSDHDTLAGLHAALRDIVDNAEYDLRLGLLRAHPDLAGRLAVRGELTDSSTSEQAGAGLDGCSPAEYAEFQELNDRYKEKFGFPYILAVRGYDRAGILDNFRTRIENDTGTEFDEALKQVHRIAFLRLSDRFQD